jgi:hypothetical protein
MLANIFVAPETMFKFILALWFSFFVWTYNQNFYWRVTFYSLLSAQLYYLAVKHWLPRPRRPFSVNSMLTLWFSFFVWTYNKNFYETVTFYSLLFAQLYYLAGLPQYRLPRPRQPFSIDSLLPALASLAWNLFQYAPPFFLGLWLLALTPFHLIYSPMDLWATYTDHEPLKPYNVLYDAGQNVKAE